jgi:hypothetical protein
VAGGENPLVAVTEYVNVGMPPAGTPLTVPVVGLIDRNEAAEAVRAYVANGMASLEKVARYGLPAVEVSGTVVAVIEGGPGTGRSRLKDQPGVVDCGCWPG